MGLLQSLDSGTLKDLGEQFGTPLYIYDGDLIAKRYKDLYEFIKWPKLEVFYAMKANYNVGILKNRRLQFNLLRRVGSHGGNMGAFTDFVGDQ